MKTGLFFLALTAAFSLLHPAALLADGADESGKLKPMESADAVNVPAERVFGTLYKAGVLPLNGELLIYVPGEQPIKASHAGGALPEIIGQTPPDFIVLSGSREKLNAAAAALGIPKDEMNVAPLLGDLLAGKSQLNLPGGKPSGEGYDDEYPALDNAAQAEMDLIEFRRRGGGYLSDVRVTLDASAGLNIYDCFRILSAVSGISIVVDPYAFMEPVGGRRAPLQQPPAPGGSTGPGEFRDAGEFQTAGGGTGGAPAFYGIFRDTPFDIAFETIVSSNNLDYMVIPNESDPYSKPILFVTSRERMEHELNISGVSSISLYQTHYADPNQLQQILMNMNVLPSTDTGFYIYRGGLIGGQGGLGQGGGTGGGGTGRGGSGGGGGAGGSGSFGAGIPLPTAKSGLMIIKGTGADHAAFFNRLVGRESKVRDGRRFFMKVALSPEAMNDTLPASELTGYLVML
ncbi:MAG: hypothetical protein HRF49_10240 [bacterium]|jgi:hypothetical protein